MLTIPGRFTHLQREYADIMNSGPLGSFYMLLYFDTDFLESECRAGYGSWHIDLFRSEISVHCVLRRIKDLSDTRNLRRYLIPESELRTGVESLRYYLAREPMQPLLPLDLAHFGCPMTTCSRVEARVLQDLSSKALWCSSTLQHRASVIGCKYPKTQGLQGNCKNTSSTSLST